METVRQKKFTGERALFQAKDLYIYDTIFAEGESCLKESNNIVLESSGFQWKYPLWYSSDIRVKNCMWHEMARAGVWYTNHIKVEDSMIDAPKNFRRCNDVSLMDVSFSDAQETLWSCQDVRLEKVFARGDYFAMNCADLVADGFTLYGNYSFDGASNVVIRNARMISKDAFWNSENVTVYDSYISGEYLGWNARNLKLVGCTVESLQGMCYIDHLVMENCKLINTTLAFEYSTVEADIKGNIDSVFNPSGGKIRADSISRLILEKDKVNPEKTVILCEQIGETVGEWQKTGGLD